MLALAVVLAACQPAGGPAPPATEQAADGPRRGAPAVTAPQQLDELLAQTRSTAEEWQDEPRPAQVTVDLAEDGRWTAAQVVYVAADADRYLVVEATPDGLRQQRPTLAAVDVPPVPAAAVEKLPALPSGTREPAALAAEAAEPLAECQVGAVTTVLYDTGAPFTWDGSTWTVTPEWSATLLNADGGGVVVDPVDAAAPDDPCV